MRLLGSSQCNHHHQTGTDQEIPGCLSRSKQRTHQECIRRRRSPLRHQIHIGRIANQRNTDKVHQVISGKSQCQGKSTQHHNNLEYIHLQPVKDLHQDSKENKSTPHHHAGIAVNKLFQIAGHKRTFLQPFYQHKIKDGSSRQAAKQRYKVFCMFLIIKCKDETRNILHHASEEESNRHRKEDGENHGKSLIGIQQIPQLQSTVGIGYLDQ